MSVLPFVLAALGPADLAVLLVIAALAALAVFTLLRRKKKGSSCCGGGEGPAGPACGGCSSHGSCPYCQAPDKEEKDNP